QDSDKGPQYTPRKTDKDIDRVEYYLKPVE
ncbi:MAG: hypothetical protein H6Q55_2062, partial [Deltaproteobacteria bacterium]|nr:hypothetical protein [Deltaproteobacteria bacterium]